MSDCKHIEQKFDLDGETIIEKHYTSLFCPDCGKRLVDKYTSKPFSL